MPTSSNARRFFSMLSSASLAAGLVSLAPSAMAACPEPDPGLIPYTGARAPTNVCTPADHKLILDKINTGTATFVDVETALKAQSATCAACVFSSETDTAWGPFVYAGDEGGAFVNWGGCFEKGAGGSKACGQAVTQMDFCIGARCIEGTGYCTSANAYDTCVTTVATDTKSCGQYDVGTACPDYETQYDVTCKDLFSVIGVLCGGATPTTTTDAGTPPNPDGGTGTTPKPPKADAGSGGKKDAAASTDEDEDDGEQSPPPSTGTGGKKKDAGASNSADDVAVTDSSSGCAQSGTSSTSSVATALVAMVAIGGAMRSRRRSKR